MTNTRRYLILGTAGHIDHGKTTLIKALTGTDCDRLAEEKDRGITIDIGFAHLDLPAPDGGAPVTLGIIDVPGHRRFIRNMVAGAAGIDLLLLVVAADDSVMPQTVEHLHIARLLGVKTGLVAINKVDLADPDLLELVRDDIATLAAGTFLEGCPIIPVSAVTGAGIPELLQALEATAVAVPARRFGDRFRMPVDRSFSIKGAGTVVTGTIWAGDVQVDDELELLPARRKLRVRGIQVHGLSVREAGAGRRAALNLAGIEKDDVQRGDLLAALGSIIPTTMLDAQLELLPGRFAPLRRGSEALLHIGTSEINVKLQPLDVEAIAPGGSAIAQLRLSAEVAVAVGDRFILRHSSSEFTMGGGSVLDAHPHPHRRKRAEAVEQLSTLAGAGLVEALLHEVAKAPYGLELNGAAQLLNASREAISTASDSAMAHAQGLLQHAEGRQLLLTLPVNRARIAAVAAKALTTFHAAHPLLATGLSLQELLRIVHSHGAGVPAALLELCLGEPVASGQLVLSDGTYRSATHVVRLTDKDQRAIAVVLKRVGEGFTPPQPEEFAAETPCDRGRLKLLLEHLVESGQLVLAPGAVYFERERVAQARAELLRFLATAPGITVSQFGQLLDSSRKYAIPLLQHFEQSGMLIRDGDLRKLAQP